MKDFEKRLVQPFRFVLEWRFEEYLAKGSRLRIETERLTARRYAARSNRRDPVNKVRAIPSAPDRVEVKIYIPEKYKRSFSNPQLHLDSSHWKDPMTPFTIVIVNTLYSLGIAAALADACTSRHGYFTFAVARSSEVYGCLPQLRDGQLDSKILDPKIVEGIS